MQQEINRITEAAGQVLLGKEKQIRLACCCLFTGGHLLIEDLPGMGKTTLSQVLARLFGLSFTRIQFTSDLLPADITGCSVYDTNSGSFVFHSGPIFSQLVLADEINRASPKTQSALLEAMEERQVSMEGETRSLPEPFFVIATQNPVSMAGTFALPESQLDRFHMCLQLGYPDSQTERRLLENGEQPDARSLSQCIDHSRLAEIRQQAGRVVCSAALLDYAQRLIAATREHDRIAMGLSPRGALAVVAAARTWAMIEGRDHVIPEDVQQVFPAVTRHRLIFTADEDGSGVDALIEDMLESVAVF